MAFAASSSRPLYQSEAFPQTGTLTASFPALRSKPSPRTIRLGVALAALAFLNVLLYWHTVQIEGTANRYQREIIATKQENLVIQAELAGIQSPDQVEEIALNKLGMYPPSRIQYLAAPQSTNVNQLTTPSQPSQVLRLPASGY